VRHQVAAVDEPRALFGGRQCRDLLGERACGGPVLRGVVLQFDAQRAPRAAQGQFRRAPAPLRAATRELPQHECAPQVAVGVVLPGEPDTTEHLDAVLGVVDRGVQRDGGGDRGGQRVFGGCLVGRARRVPRDGARLFHPAQHLDAQVFHRLERPDRSAELLAGAGVLDGRAQAPARDPARLGGEQRDREVHRVGWVDQHAVRRDLDTGQRHAAERAGEVHRRVLDHGHVRGGHDEPGVPVREQQVRRPARAEDVPDLAVGHQAAVGAPHRAHGSAGQGQRDRGAAVGERVGQVGVREQHARQRGGQHRAGHQRVRGLFEHGGEVDQPAALVRSGQREDAESREVGPVHRSFRFGRPFAHARLCRALLVGHRDGHPASFDT
jgi:hypothetical protein